MGIERNHHTCGVKALNAQQLIGRQKNQSIKSNTILSESFLLLFGLSYLS